MERLAESITRLDFAVGARNIINNVCDAERRQARSERNLLDSGTEKMAIAVRNTKDIILIILGLIYWIFLIMLPFITEDM